MGSAVEATYVISFFSSSKFSSNHPVHHTPCTADDGHVSGRLPIRAHRRSVELPTYKTISRIFFSYAHLSYIRAKFTFIFTKFKRTPENKASFGT